MPWFTHPFTALAHLPTRIRGWLSRPFPVPGSGIRRLRIAGVTGGFVAVFLWAFHPFDMARFFPEGLFGWICLGYGAITSAVYLLVMEGLVRSGWVQEARWTIFREMGAQALLVSLIAVANMLYTDALQGRSTDWGRVGAWLVITWQVAAFPIVFNTAFRHYVALRRQLAAARSLDVLAHRAVMPDSPVAQDSPVHLSGKNREEDLHLPLPDILAIEATGNYLKVFFLKNSQPTYALIRLTLQEAIRALPPEGPVQRCHRSFVVNLNRVTAVTGNAQGLRLSVQGMKESVPVSRAYVEPVRTRLRDLRS